MAKTAAQQAEAEAGGVVVRITETVHVKRTVRGSRRAVRRLVRSLPSLAQVQRTRTARTREQHAAEGQHVGLHITDPQTNE